MSLVLVTGRYDSNFGNVELVPLGSPLLLDFLPRATCSLGPRQSLIKFKDRAALVERSPSFFGIPAAEKICGRAGDGDPYLIVARTVITDAPEAVGPLPVALMAKVSSPLYLAFALYS